MAAAAILTGVVITAIAQADVNARDLWDRRVALEWLQSRVEEARHAPPAPGSYPLQSDLDSAVATMEVADEEGVRRVEVRLAWRAPSGGTREMTLTTYVEAP